ncbi:hypothetical protein ACFLUA_03325 [Chloroflexota bacterium]
MSSKRKNYVLLGIIAGAVLLRVGAAFLLGNPVVALPGIADQVSYHALASRLTGGYGFTFGRGWWPYTAAGQPTAHWSYLYTLFLAGIYAVIGIHPLVARIIQAVLSGVLMPLFAYRISKQAFRQYPDIKIISLIAAAWTALYGYFIYYAAALMTETFYIIGILWTLDCALRIQNQSSIEGNKKSSVKTVLWIEFGLAIGFTVLLRQVFLLFTPFLFGWLLWVFLRRTSQSRSPARKAFKELLRGGLICAAVLVLLIVPITLYNYSQFGQFVLLNTNAGFAFFWGNHPIYGVHFMPILTPDMGSYQALIPQELRSLNEAALDQALLKLGFGFITSDPVRFIKLSITRIPAYFMFWPSVASSLPSNLTRVFSFGLALPFMMLGIAMWIQDVHKRRVWAAPGVLLIMFIAINSAIHLLSWALIRYRLPVDAVGLIFAAIGIYWLYQKIFSVQVTSPEIL